MPRRGVVGPGGRRVRSARRRCHDLCRPAPCAGTLQQALSAAAALPGDDTVQLGPGIFDGPFEYVSGSGAVEVRGAGAGQTNLTAPASGLPVLKLAVPGSKASGLQIDKKGSSYGVSLEAATLEDALITGDYQSGGRDSDRLERVGFGRRFIRYGRGACPTRGSGFVLSVGRDGISVGLGHG